VQLSNVAIQPQNWKTNNCSSLLVGVPYGHGNCDPEGKSGELPSIPTDIYFSITEFFRFCQNLQPGEKLLVDTESILCFESSVTIDIQWVGNVAAICCGGEGLFNTTMTGPGKIWMQSMSIDKMRTLFPPKVSSSGGGDSGDRGGD
jgi:hypothetical protein